MDFGVMTFFALLLLGAFIHTARMTAKKWDTSWRHMYIFLTIVFAVLGSTIGYLELRHQLLQQHLTQVARAVSSNDYAQVKCARFSASALDLSTHWGYVMWDSPNTAILKSNTCKHLRAYLNSDKNTPSHWQTIAVHTLTHESGHLSGIRDEAKTECWAIQRNLSTALRLGATVPQAEELSAKYMKDHYPNVPTRYKSKQCRDGGAYDESPDDGVFP